MHHLTAVLAVVAVSDPSNAGGGNRLPCEVGPCRVGGDTGVQRRQLHVRGDFAHRGTAPPAAHGMDDFVIIPRPHRERMGIESFPHPDETLSRRYRALQVLTPEVENPPILR